MKIQTLETGRTRFEFHFYQIVLLLSKSFNIFGPQLSQQLTIIVIIIIIPYDMILINNMVIYYGDIVEIT